MSPPLRHPLLQWLIYGHVWLAVCVAAQILWVGLFLHDATDLDRYTLAAAFGTFAGYAVMRLARVHGPEVPRYPNLLWYQLHRRSITFVAIAAAVSAFVLIWPLWGLLWRWLLPVMVLALLYVTPFTASSGRGFGLRSIPFLKVLLIPCMWVIVTAAAPLVLDEHHHSLLSIAAFACMRLPLILALAITFDIRDSATDDPALRTVPLIFGLRAAKAIALLLLVVSLIFEVVFLRGLGYSAAGGTVLFGYAVAAILIARAKPVRDPIYYALYVDGVMVLIPLCVWIGTMF